MPDTIEKAGVKQSALASIAGGAMPDPEAVPLNQVLPKKTKGGKRPGAGRKPKNRRGIAPGIEQPEAADDEIDAATAERTNNAVALNRSIDTLLRLALGQEMHASDKEMAQLDAALVAYQEIKGTVPVPIELVLITAYGTVYGAKLTQPTPKLRLYAAWLKLRGAVVAIVHRLRRRK